jgi:glycerol-3-phosphate acyltransferase PlsX
MSSLVIAVDAMGSDLGPNAIVEGALQAAESYPELRLILVGQEEPIRAALSQQAPNERVSVLNAPEVIETHETPTSAIRQKKGSSIVVGLNAVKDGQASGFVSAGSTGALLTGATLIIGRQEGIERPALGTLLPNQQGLTLLIDCGANMDAKPSYLMQFGQMGSDYMHKVMGIDRPKVGLINVGVEKEKGNAAAKEAYGLLEGCALNFVGNVEAREIPAGAVDVAVCDGFVGNVVLKFAEGFAKSFMAMIKEELMSTTKYKIGALMAKGAFKNLKKRFDYREVGGAPFLGLKSLVIKAHGSSDALAIKNAIRQCVIFEKVGK